MLSFLYNNNTERSYTDHKVWHQWQSTQPREHFETSSIYTYYKKHRTTFATNKKYYNDIVYRYCFGDFSYLLVDPTDSNSPCHTIYEYIRLLLDFYDVCKGISRRFFGDPSCIVLLRKVLDTNSIDLLSHLDFFSIQYDYTTIHAHTVSNYSISTLLCFFISNYLRFFESKFEKTYPKINFLLCQKTFIERTFGTLSFDIPTTSPSITIPNTKNQQKEPKWHSWPQSSGSIATNTSYCSQCNRISENLWGSLNTCLDCHLHKIGILETTPTYQL